jgi:hypothetical protein
MGGVWRMRMGLSVLRDLIIDGTRPQRPDRVTHHLDLTCVSRIPGLPKESVRARLEASYARLAEALAHEAENAS